ncbi:TIGR03088 family PEP-CTERM/XrtA system glycosyltransferase [Noviherbaspirillum massiliense]|uniref:TIGR03088 family PEP-CTERM/XrtA system glycosyltransferase n=1 Tax=Noviherbaspirillum massiliense TaxID=1465823 RepID=UPI001FDF0B69|nr:TIGR03088 family PEP-CTERM/XrtA system glycosyltransferase [Noviherbaspirillum massiliense]
MTPPPLVVHLIYRLDFGGLETLLVECINRMPPEKYRHAVVCLTGFTGFARKIARADVEIHSLDKPPGLGLHIHFKLWKLLRRLQPAILHTYNIAAAEYAFTATLAGVPVRIHAEHGRSADDPEGRNRSHNLLRRLLLPVIDCYVPVSRDLQRWLRDTVGIPDAKNRLVPNGVDTARFSPFDAGTRARKTQDGCFVIGTVGRVQDVKDHRTLLDAFIHLRKSMPARADQLRLAIVGDGPLLPAIRLQAAEAGIADAVWLPGARTDIPDVMRGFSLFVLSSVAEGTPVTLLEAMASGLPVVATQVGGIPEVVIDGVSGMLVAPSDPEALAVAISTYLDRPERIARHGSAGRSYVEEHFSIAAMLGAYLNLYDELCARKIKPRGAVEPCVES